MTKKKTGPKKPPGRPRKDGRPPGSVPPDEEKERKAAEAEARRQEQEAAGTAPDTGTGAVKDADERQQAAGGPPPPPPKTEKIPLGGVLPAEIIAVIATVPLALIQQAGVHFADVYLAYDREVVAQAGPAFEAWLASQEIELTPGWAYVGVLGAALVTAQRISMDDVRAQQAARAGAAGAANGAAAPGGPAAAQTVDVNAKPARGPDAGGAARH